jgi:hypothetical protein
MIKVFYLLIILLFSCSTTDNKPFPPPTDYSEVIKQIQKQVEKEPEQSKKEVLQKAKQVIQSQSYYSNECFSKLENFEERLSKIELENKKLKEENQELKAKLWEYQKIEIVFWIIVSILAFALVWKFISPFVLPIIKKMAGIPI